MDGHRHILVGEGGLMALTSSREGMKDKGRSHYTWDSVFGHQKTQCGMEEVVEGVLKELMWDMILCIRVAEFCSVGVKCKDREMVAIGTAEGSGMDDLPSKFWWESCWSEGGRSATGSKGCSSVACNR